MYHPANINKPQLCVYYMCIRGIQKLTFTKYTGVMYTQVQMYNKNFRLFITYTIDF